MIHSTQPTIHLGREEYAIYTGQVSSSFAPILAGITYPDPGYEIYRSGGTVMSSNMYCPAGARCARTGRPSP